MRAPACAEMHAGTVDVFRSSARFGFAGCWWRDAGTRDAGGAHAPPAQSPRPTVRASLPPPSCPATTAIPTPPCPAPARQCLPTRIAISWPRTARAIRRRTRGAGWPGAVAWWRSDSVSAAGWGRLAWVWRPPATARTHRTAAQGHPARLTRGASAQISWPPCHRDRDVRPCRSAGHGRPTQPAPLHCSPHRPGASAIQVASNVPVGRVSARERRRAMVRPAAARHRLPWRAPARPAPRARRAHHTASVSPPASVLHPTWSAPELIATVAHTANTTHRCRPSPRLALCPLTCACPEPGRGRRCPDWPRRLPTPLPTHKPATAIAPLTPPALIGIAQPPPRHRVSPWIHGPSVR